MLVKKSKAKKHWDKKGSRKKVTYMRPVSMLRLLLWQSYALMLAAVVNMGLTMWHHEMTMMELESKFKDTTRLVRTCNDIGWKDCNEFRKAWKENKR